MLNYQSADNKGPQSAQKNNQQIIKNVATINPNGNYYLYEPVRFERPGAIIFKIEKVKRNRLQV